MYISVHTAFKAALAEADFQRREYIRVKEGKKKWISYFFFCFLFNSFLPAHQVFYFLGEQVSEHECSSKDRSGPPF